MVDLEFWNNKKISCFLTFSMKTCYCYVCVCVFPPFSLVVKLTEYLDTFSPE